MLVFQTLLFILFLMIIISALAEYLRIPPPLLLVMSGLLIAFIPGMPSWFPPEELVLTIFLPPILFNAALVLSWPEFKENIIPISSLAVFLVILTAFVVAYVLYLLVPGINFATALVFGAIISPPDAMAATSILTRMRIAPRLTSILEGESLINDASGIILYNFAVVMAVTSVHTSFATTLSDFLFVASGGLLVGFIMGVLLGMISNYILKENPILIILMRNILPFITYILADQMGVSAVLAVVSAALTCKTLYANIMNAKTRLIGRAVSDTIIFLLNGLIFILIGLQFPSILQDIKSIPLSNLFIISVIIIITTVGVRFLWVSITTPCYVLGKRNYFKYIPLPFPAWKNILIVSWSGMRGIVSLALALALPLYLDNGQPFPFRNLIIFLTFVVIIFTLEVQGFTLPWLIKILKMESDSKNNKKIARLLMMLTKESLAKIESLDPNHPKLSAEIKELIRGFYKNRQYHLKGHLKTPEIINKIHFNAQLKALLNEERRYLHEMLQNGTITQQESIEMARLLDLEEVRYLYEE